MLECSNEMPERIHDKKQKANMMNWSWLVTVVILTVVLKGPQMSDSSLKSWSFYKQKSQSGYEIGF